MANVKNLVFDLTATQVELLPENARRIHALFVNNSDAVCWLMLGTEAVANWGIRLNADGGSYEINFFQNPYRGKVYGVSSGVTKRLMVTEVSY